MRRHRWGRLVVVALAVVAVAAPAWGPAKAGGGAAARPAHLPTVVVSGEGLNMLGVHTENVSPSDSTGAVGTDRYVELVNQKYGLYDRSGSLIESSSAQDFTGLAGSDLLDGEVLWAPGQGRFFYSMIDATADWTFNQVAFGFSRSADPDVDGWCHYTSTFGAPENTFPDFPRLGDTGDFVLIGVNRFTGGRGRYLGSDLDWYAKPAPGVLATCPTDLASGRFADLQDPLGKRLFSPVPPKQVDPSATGYVLGVQRSPLARTGFTLVTVTTGSGQQPSLSPPETIPVPLPFQEPPPAPQSGTQYALETLDGRFTQAYAAIDPSRLDPRTGQTMTAIWTQHTIDGSEIRWYEIDPSSGSLFQSGIVQSASLYVFNGAIAPDRAVNGTSAMFGDSMVVGFDTSSASADVALQMVSKVGQDPPSPFVRIRQSPGPNIDETCLRGASCRWGDFAGASPDPAPLSGLTGTVWVTDTYNRASQGDLRIDWRTLNWAALP